MPQFAPGETRTAVATLPVKPAGLSCTIEVWLALNGSKMATSGEIPFVSTGVEQSITLPDITMPDAGGTYPVYIDVLIAGLLTGWRAAEDVVIAPVAPPGGEILEVSWWSEALASWRPIPIWPPEVYPEPYPAHTYITHRFRVKNTGGAGAFKVGYSWYSPFTGAYVWTYSPTVDIEADTEGNIDWKLFSAPGTYITTFHLFSNGNDVDSVKVALVVV